MSKVWANPTWFFLHGMAEKVDEEFYNKNYRACLGIVKQICNILPCPICRKEAIQYIKNIRPHHVKDKESFKKMLFVFHNKVNARLRKRRFLYKDLEKYKNLKFIRTTQVMCRQLRRFNSKSMYRATQAAGIVRYINNIENSVRKYIKFFL